MSAKAITIGLNVTCIVGLISATVLAAVMLKESNDTVKLSTQTAQLAQELRQSSDDLTRFIRTYTVTGNASYWGYFQQVIGIRNGELPLPVDPWRNHWDLFISDGVAPRGYGPPHALRDRMRAAEFTAAELALLDEAQRQSDALIDLEDVASHAMQGRYRPSNTTGLTTAEARNFSVVAAPNQTFAMQLVHGVAYHQWKGRIMRPLDEFAAMSATRVEQAIAKGYRINIVLAGVLAFMVVVLIAVLGIYFGKVAADAQTQHLLSAVLPERVVNSISASQFQALRKAAGDRAKHIRSHRKSLGGSDAVEEMAKSHSRRASAAGATPATEAGLSLSLSAFPVLYSEFLPTAWVAFTDVVSFTDMCRYTPSHEVISILNELFSLIDIAAIRYKVEKIKTIGDAFMAAKLSVSEDETDCGAGANAARIARDGFEMVHFLLRACSLARGVMRPVDPEANSTAENPFLELRVGLNVGPCASGIVGFERPLYDLFGDTVNTAARLEASGQVGRVHVLESTIPHFGKYADSLFCDGGRHDVALKGLGVASTRFVLGATSLGDDGDGTLEDRESSHSTTDSSNHYAARRTSLASVHTAQSPPDADGSTTGPTAGAAVDETLPHRVAE